MALNEEKLQQLATSFLGAWNSQDVAAVLGCYTEDVIYLDPNTRGEVRGAEVLRRYLTKLFADWKMTWHLRQAYALAADEGTAVLWRASFQRAGGERSIEVNGMDLVLLRGERILRNEVYFDRTVIAPLMNP
jgi:ketosteroid isomerase-like protein